MGKFSGLKSVASTAKNQITTASNAMGMSAPGMLYIGAATYGEIKGYQQTGSSFESAVTKAGAASLVRSFSPVAGAAMDFGPLAYDGLVSANRFRRQKTEDYWSYSHPENVIGSGMYQDSAQAQTMRQAAVQQIQGNKLNARSALGGEAKLFSPLSNRR